ncbi:MAG TPA: peptide MFS transporter [Thermoanaerobaculia bacterium]
MSNIAVAEKQWFGHPRGLATLFFTEMWERYSYYGMRALLFLYMVGSTQQPGLGFDEKHAGSIYGWYTFSVYATGLIGGLIADHWLGHYRSVFAGGVIIALGHFCMVFRQMPFFFAGLVLIVIGTGLLKPNVSTLVGSLYKKDDPRRDAGFSLFYSGINLGAFFGPIVTAWLVLKFHNWHYGFAAAGIGMVAGLIQYAWGKKYLVPADPDIKEVEEHPKSPTPALTRTDWMRIAVIGILFCFSVVFWAGYEQAGTSLNLFADRATQTTVFGWVYPSPWLQSVAPLCVWLFAPVFAWLWLRLGPREPSSPAKFMLGLAFLSISYVLILQAAHIFEGTHQRVSPWWLVVLYLLQTFGEICLYPTGMSMVTKLSPPHLVGVLMGIFFLSIAIGNKVAGYVAGFLKDLPFSAVFQIAFISAGVAAILLILLIRPIRKMMGDVH